MPLPVQRITGSNFAYQHLPFERFLDDAADLGRERLELWGIAAHLHIPQVGDAEARVVRRRAETHGLVDDYFDALGGRVRHVHLIDGSPAGHLAWDDGELPPADYLAALDRRGYDGHLTFELFGDGTYAFEPRPAVERCLAPVRSALAPHV
ncbi:sugar phosphate isomerase/epimerase family protein [Sphaerisporangium perillae]|uniref:sugar phosphate isomerase/epimerase family protein n=1 Tax=Sphaerisporangium perillae TaxID=2935860 RepID=UPI00200D7F4D|nr:hypothetical protein [Sphaerisporangium perillae]